MPVVNTIGKCDIALLSSDSGSLPSSQGATAYPFFDPNNFWDPDTGQRKIIGQAAGTGGDRHNLQTADGADIRKYDRNGTAHHYIGPTSNPSNIYHQLHAPQTDAARPGISFNFSGSVHTNQDGTLNNVWGIGSNDNGGVPVIPGQYLFRDGWEDNYVPVMGVTQTERHVGAVYNPNTGQEIRPYTASVVTSTNPMKAQVSHEASFLNQTLEVDRTTILESSLIGDDYNFYTLAFSAYQNIPALLNQTSFGNNGLDSSLKVNGRTARHTFQLNGVSKWSWVGHSDNNFYLNNGSELNAVQFSQTSLEARFSGTIFGAPGGSLPRVLRLANVSSTNGDGDFSWRIGGLGSGVDGELQLVHTPSSTVRIRINKNGFALNNSAPVAKAADPGTAVGTDAAVINAIATIIRNLGFCS